MSPPLVSLEAVLQLQRQSLVIKVKLSKRHIVLGLFVVLVKDVLLEQKVVLLLVRNQGFLGTLHSPDLQVDTLATDVLFAGTVEGLSSGGSGLCGLVFGAMLEEV